MARLRAQLSGHDSVLYLFHIFEADQTLDRTQNGVCLIRNLALPGLFRLKKWRKVLCLVFCIHL